MYVWLNFALELVNLGLISGLSVGAILLLRPLLLRVLSHQQRVVVWVAIWTIGWHPWDGTPAILPVPFQTLVTSRTGRNFGWDPVFLPHAYEGTGDYNLHSPGTCLFG